MDRMKLVDLLDEPVQYRVPVFQRTYEWDRSRWNGFWEDIKDLYDSRANDSRFLGTLVFRPIRTRSRNGEKVYQIIDGQQRLVTLSLLLYALSRHRRAVAGEASAYLRNPSSSRGCELKLLPSEESRDREIYRRLLSTGPSVDIDHNIARAFDFFCGKVKAAGLNPRRLLDTLKNRLWVVPIILDEEDDPYQVYESLNYKKLSLSDADLIRNFILLRLKDDDVLQGNVYKKWKRITTVLGDNTSNIRDFLWHYLKMRYGNVKRRAVYAKVKAVFGRKHPRMKPEELAAEVEKMSRFAACYRCFIWPDAERDRDVRLRLEAIAKLDVTTCYPLLLRLYDVWQRGRITAEELAGCLDLIISFVVRRYVCEVPTNALNHLFLQWCKAINADEPLKWLTAEMAQGHGNTRWPDDAEFRNRFQERRFDPRKTTTRYILEQLELALGGSNAPSICTIEHIMPQVLSEDWKTDLGGNYQSIHEEWLNNIGNLTLIRKDDLGNKAFGEKRRQLAKSTLDLNKLTAAEQSWGPAQISRRAKTLMNLACGLWHRREV